MASKIEWTPRDYAASDMIDEMLSKMNLSYREIEERLEGQMSYNRVRDIRLGRRAPVRLSEFIAICDLCGVPAGSAVNELTRRASEQVDKTDPQWLADHIENYDFAAKLGNTEAEQEAYEELP